MYSSVPFWFGRQLNTLSSTRHYHNVYYTIAMHPTFRAPNARVPPPDKTNRAQEEQEQGTIFVLCTGVTRVWLHTLALFYRTDIVHLWLTHRAILYDLHPVSAPQSRPVMRVCYLSPAFSALWSLWIRWCRLSHHWCLILIASWSCM